ncbi:LacI family DNA-binding transcriptional regulator [Clostridium perfringens]|uniref:LacI family DNA-binding transcriptional regulator n=1 Tax=Clostridium perfringens TaxID=1502 RepID=UPI0024BD1EDA|nr:LacI family DNA-binding transcriptional regulator [Clostridium perfringens]
MGKTTLLDIAKAVNVSKTTVSMVLNNKEINVSKETREKIFKAAKDMNYIPNSLARSLSTKKSYTLGMIIPDIQNPFFSEMAKAIEVESEKHGYSIILCNTLNEKKKEEEYLKLLISKLVDGVIIAAFGDGKEWIKILKNNKIPFVMIDRMVSDEKNANGVFCDNKKGVELGVNYLVNRGNKHIAFVTGKANLEIANLRLEGFKNTAKSLGISNETIIEESDFSMEGGINATERIIKNNKKVDAIFYSSDVMAIGGMKYLIRNGYKIPEDISILGYDNINICSYMEPELTTIAQPIYKIGESSCKLLMDLINNKSLKSKIINLEPSLVERGTVK